MGLRSINWLIRVPCARGYIQLSFLLVMPQLLRFHACYEICYLNTMEVIIHGRSYQISEKLFCHLKDTFTLSPESVLLNLFSQSSIDADQELIHDVNVRQIGNCYVIKTTNKCFFGLDIVINLGGIKYLRLCCMLIRFWGDVLLNSRLTSFLSEQFSHCLAAH